MRSPQARVNAVVRRQRVSRVERDTEVARTAYEHALRGLDSQETALGSLHQRAAINIAIAGVTAAFLAGNGIDQSELSLCAMVAIAIAVSLLCLAVLLSLDVLRSRDGWKFSLLSDVILENYLQTSPDMAMDQVYASLAGFAQQSYRSNNALLTKLHVRLNQSYGATLFQIVFWILAISFL